MGGRWWDVECDDKCVINDCSGMCYIFRKRCAGDGDRGSACAIIT